MSTVTELSIALFVELFATGLVGFFGWRQRMRDGVLLIPIKRTHSQLPR